MSFFNLIDNIKMYLFVIFSALILNGSAPGWSCDSDDKDFQSELSGYKLLEFAGEEIEKEKKPGFLTNQQRFQFVNLAYEADDEDQTRFERSWAELLNDGWQLEKITGTTGGSINQSRSTMGVMLFRGFEVVIATRGTNIQSAHDLVTNVRVLKGGLARNIRGLFNNEKQEDDSSLQILGCQGGRIHNGFLQTHLSMWDFIKGKLIAHARDMNCPVSDLKIETLGHSLGGALQDLNQLHLLMDPSLGFGEKVVENDFSVEKSTLGMSFFALPKTERVHNKNVRGTSIEGPRVLGGQAAEEFNQRVGAGNAPHIVNKADPVPNLPPKRMGFEDTGDKVKVDSGHNQIGAHFLGNLQEEAVKELDKFDKKEKGTSKTNLEKSFLFL